MKTVNVNNNVSFGIVFKVKTAKNGVRSSDMLDFKEEIKLYNRLDKRLKRDVLEITDAGVKTKNMVLEKEVDFPKSNALRLKDKSGEYFISDIKGSSLSIGDAYRKMRQTFDELVK